MKYCYIYHVIGTLTWANIVYSIESLKNQHFDKWETFVLYNGSPFPSEEIMKLIPSDKFWKVAVYPYNKTLPKSAVADWREINGNIGNHDRYFVHKADFYLADRVCRRFAELDEERPFIVMFNKFDMKEHCPIELIRQYAKNSWEDNRDFWATGTVDNHIGKMAVPFRQIPDRTDGTMHAYNDDYRQYYKPPADEVFARWGLTRSFDIKGTKLITDPQFFVLHLYHDTIDKEDPLKNITGERF